MSEAVMMGLGDKMGRNYAHDVVYDVCREVVKTGRPLIDLAGYRVHYRDASPADGAGSQSVDVTDRTEATVADLDAGTWYFTVSALDESGNESDMSNEVSIEVGP